MKSNLLSSLAMKQKLIAIGSGGCRIAAAMLDAGIFDDAPVCLCDTSEKILAKYDNPRYSKVLLGESPFRYPLSLGDMDKIDDVIGRDAGTALIFVTALGGRTEAKYVPEFIIEASRRNFGIMVIYTMPKMEVPSPVYDRCERAEKVIAKFMQGRIVMRDSDISESESLQKIITPLKNEGTDFDTAGIADYCRKLGKDYPYVCDTDPIFQSDNYPWASFEERVELYNSNCSAKTRISL